jgi:2,4-dienoyl-CoA reductase-like NADH-dependent reductase (Old Yellow Enzyme family)
MSIKMSNPFETYKFNRSGKSVTNRAVLAALTNKQSSNDGILSDNEINWLTRRAKGGFGIITTGAAHVSKDGQAWEGELGVFDDIHIERLNVLADSVHSYDSLILAQLFHGGMHSPQKLTGNTPLSASKVRSEVSESGFARPASEEDIDRIIDDFTSAAVRCVQAGFDGIELHGAHGYLISQFLGTKTNMRKDQWGGDRKNRERFLIKIFQAIKNNVPDSFIVGVRISPEINKIGIGLDDSILLAGDLRDEGVDYIHLSCWDSFGHSRDYPDDPKTLTEWFVQSCDDLPPIISTGGVWSSVDAQNLMRQGADLIGVGRVGIAYPDWANHLSNADYDPDRPPFTVAQLSEAQLSDVFIDYMRKWEGFVAD